MNLYSALGKPISKDQDIVEAEEGLGLQITSSSVGINPIAAETGPIKILRNHMMLSTFGITSATEAGTMTHAHTFGKRCSTDARQMWPRCQHYEEISHNRMTERDTSIAIQGR